jgi:hypothetical protein
MSVRLKVAIATLVASSTTDFGRHLTMLPSRGLRPAHLGPLSSRQAAILRSNASRKVRMNRVARFACPSISASPPHRTPQYHMPPARTMPPAPLHTHLCQLTTSSSTVLTLSHVVLISIPDCRPVGPVMSSKPASVGQVENRRNRAHKRLLDCIVRSEWIVVCSLELGQV